MVSRKSGVLPLSNTVAEFVAAGQGRTARRPVICGEGPDRYRRIQVRLGQSGSVARCRSGGGDGARSTGAADGRGPSRREDPDRRSRVRDVRNKSAFRHADQSEGARARSGRIFQRICLGGGGKHLRFRARNRYRRIGPRSRELLRSLWLAHNVRPACRWPESWRWRRASTLSGGSRATPRTLKRVGEIYFGPIGKFRAARLLLARDAFDIPVRRDQRGALLRPRNHSET